MLDFSRHPVAERHALAHAAQAAGQIAAKIGDRLDVWLAGFTDKIGAALDGLADAATKARAVLTDPDLTQPARHRKAEALLAEPAAAVRAVVGDEQARIESARAGAERTRSQAALDGDVRGVVEAVYDVAALDRTLAYLRSLPAGDRSAFVLARSREGDRLPYRAATASGVYDQPVGGELLREARRILADLANPATAEALRDLDVRAEVVSLWRIMLDRHVARVYAATVGTHQPAPLAGATPEQIARQHGLPVEPFVAELAAARAAVARGAGQEAPGPKDAA
jgi:hypothetical protein